MKVALIQFVVALLLLVGAVVGYGAWYSLVSTKSASVASLQAQIDAKKETATRISSARAALAEIADNENVVSNYFVPQSGVVDFIDSLEAQGKSLGSSVDVLSVAAQGSGDHPTLAISLSVIGSFDAVMRTVGSIEFAPYDLTVTSLSVQGGEKGRWRADVALSLGSTAGDASVPVSLPAPKTPVKTATTTAPSGKQPL